VGKPSPMCLIIHRTPLYLHESISIHDHVEAHHLVDAVALL
jgi:hypothetical protein